MNSVYILMLFIWFIGWLYAVGDYFERSTDPGLVKSMFVVSSIVIWPIYLGYTRDR